MEVYSGFKYYDIHYIFFLPFCFRIWNKEFHNLPFVKTYNQNDNRQGLSGLLAC